MVNLTRIYTRTGDDGTTRLGDMSKTTKNDPRLIAYADVDEANCAIGAAIALGGLPEQISGALSRIQNELFDVGADLCNPVVDDPEIPPLRIEQRDIDRLERDCDHFNDDLPALRSFILPGGTPGSALLHVARTVTRRAERATWAALDAHGDTMNALTAKYLNRLSDLLFILARAANHSTVTGEGEGEAVGDVLWQPGASRDGDSSRDPD
ncbi:MAG TPA: cob(I)yrinic acid a,c-diamide adenosyltransferase [Actinocrinis sp.]|uniref:cob(I)yrinic acid a,c-diamide adenosyltransferase n=1 Tax=Actinocrinis sp. TaxID=1920516 RepID=UPI002DDDBD4B|nr:cob(I)yrinic acid a,c-diamide adenosyltransferase [Actinocrinis sp.]HEV2345455.1 cob(I)yrinic acid a,c-diamide adenosyltransferase [Actinocrinis sp.]